MDRQIDINDLFQKKVQREEMRLSVYDTILERVHRRIKLAASQDGGLTFSTFILPEVMIGQPLFNAEQCRSFVMTSLVKNGFRVRYNHPNLLLISWEHLKSDFERADKVIKEEQKLLLDESLAKAAEEQRRLQEEYDKRVMMSNDRQNEYERSMSRTNNSRAREIIKSTEDYIPSMQLRNIYFNKQN